MKPQLREIPICNGQVFDVVKSPTGTLKVLHMDYVPLLKGESLSFRFNDDFTKAIVFKLTPYDVEGNA